MSLPAQAPSAISTLPTDVLIDIFYCICPVLEDPELFSLDHRVSTNENPLGSLAWQFPGDQVVLSHVCRKWREIVTTSMPRLWSIIFLTNCHDQAQLQAALFWTRVCVERSQSAPLFIDIAVRLPTDSGLVDGVLNRHALIGAFLDLLIPHIRRWRTFRFKSDNFDYDLSAILTAEHLPQLEVLMMPDPFGNATQLIPRAPKLRRYELNGVPPSSPFPGLTQLTHLSIHYRMTRNSIVNVFANCDQLVELSMMFVHDHNDSSSGTVTLPGLRTLRLLVYTESSHLYQALVTPNLTTLRIEYCADEAHDWETFSAFVAHCSSTLRQLEWKSDQFQHRHLLIRYLAQSCMIALRDLRLRHAYIAAHVFESMDLPSLPSLENIDVEFWLDVDESILSAFAGAIALRLGLVDLYDPTLLLSHTVATGSASGDGTGTNSSYFDLVSTRLAESGIELTYHGETSNNWFKISCKGLPPLPFKHEPL